VETHSAHARIGTALDRADALLRRLKVSKEERKGRDSICLFVCLFVCHVRLFVWVCGCVYIILELRVNVCVGGGGEEGGGL
jgi:hypothetical protein